jgi:hypothetical protein
MNGGEISGNTWNGVYVLATVSGTFTMSGTARGALDNPVDIFYSSSTFKSIFVGALDAGTDPVALVSFNLSLLGKQVVKWASGFGPGPLPGDRFGAGDWLVDDDGILGVKAVPLKPGEVAVGWLNPGAVRFYRFTAEVGKKYQVIKPSGPWEILAAWADGSGVFDSWLSLFDVDKNGEIIVMISYISYDNYSGGSYRLRYEEVN